MMCDFKPGDLVECIDNVPIHKNSRVMPELDQLYTVDAVRPSGDGYGVRLLQLTPECHKGGICACQECGWDARRFRLAYRPTQEKLAMFTGLLRMSEICPG